MSHTQTYSNTPTPEFGQKTLLENCLGIENGVYICLYNLKHEILTCLLNELTLYVFKIYKLKPCLEENEIITHFPFLRI